MLFKVTYLYSLCEYEYAVRMTMYCEAPVTMNTGLLDGELVLGAERESCILYFVGICLLSSGMTLKHAAQSVQSIPLLPNTCACAQLGTHTHTTHNAYTQNVS